MVKIGPAFGDFVTPTTIRKRRNIASFIPEELINLAPLLILFLAFAFIGVRLFYVQILRGDYYVRLSEENRTRTEIIPAPRGIILDRFERPLVANSASFKLREGEESTILSQDEALELIAKGEDVSDDVRRDYLYKDAFSHVAGYVGPVASEELILPEFSNYDISDYTGKMGLELSYEEELKGVNGKKLFEVDAKGEKIRELGRKEPVSGKSIKTTLDVNIQLSVEKAFSDVERGAVVVSDPRSGAILALYSAPSFDANLFTSSDEYIPEGKYDSSDSVISDNVNKPLLNRAISGVYPPGSTFKLITAVASLEEGKIDEGTIIEDTGSISVGGATFGNWYFLQYGRTEGPLDIVRAVARSNDIFFYKAAENTGVGKISDWAKIFRLGGQTGLDIPGESTGTVPSPSWKEDVIGEQWYLGDTYNFGIGQGYLLTTPIQVNTFTNVFANGGTLYKSHLTPDRKAVLKENFISNKTIELVREGMRKSCETGGVAFPFFNFGVESARLKIDDKNYIHDASPSANFVRINVGCKTGTSETGGDEEKPHAWITVFAPFYNPEITVTVLVENSGEGSAVAAPIAKKILAEYFKNK